MNASRPISGGSLQIENLSVGYGHIPVLASLSLDIPPGRALALVGPNGAGKSTLARAISGFLRPSAGSIRVDGVSLVGRTPVAIARSGVLHVPETRDIFGDMTVWENLRVAFDNLAPGDDRTAAFDRIHALFPILAERGASSPATSPAGSSRC